jgi:N-acyl homoserine lactone hydrolase
MASVEGRRWRALGILSMLLTLLCCAPETEPEPAVASLKLYVFDCGRMLYDDEQIDALDFGFTSADTDVRELIVPCYVIEHDRGRLLWDGGLSPATVDMAASSGGGIQMRLDRPFGEQLADIGLDTSSFDYVAFSHMHPDHVGVANEIEGATLLIQRAEYDAAFADEVTTFGFDPALYQRLRDADRQILDGDHDDFGDGRVRILSAPGHTPGHQVLFVDLEKTGPIILSGDLFVFQLNRREQSVPGFNVDAEATLKSMERIEKVLEETGAELWIEHELARFEQVAQAPRYNE